jgi:hypothetical protein
VLNRTRTGGNPTSALLFHTWQKAKAFKNTQCLATRLECGVTQADGGRLSLGIGGGEPWPLSLVWTQLFTSVQLDPH